MNEGDRDAFANLTCVVQTKPLVGEVPATIDHELRIEKASERPTSDERGHQGVREKCESCLGPQTSFQQNADHQSETDAAETGEATLPDGDPTTRVTVVVAPVGCDVRAACSD